MPNAADTPWPEELRLKPGGNQLDILFDDGQKFELSAEYLRVESPSAEVKGHGPGQEITLGGKRHVTILRIEAVGNYAVRLVFSDGHSTGLYTWEYLLKLGREQQTIWQAYLGNLREKGMTRD